MTHEPRRPISEANMVSVYDSFAREMVKVFNAHNGAEIAPILVGIVLDNSDDGFHIVLNLPGAPELFRTNETKKAIIPLVHALLDPDSQCRACIAKDAPPPDLIVQISEAWVTHRKTVDGEYLDLSKEIPPSENPDRQEAIMVLVHSSFQTIGGHCPIHATPTRHAEYGPCADEVQGKKMSMNTPRDDATMH